mmetsp:Transcript_35764/g.91970  ORF Transcript_35764/g.91970 Transcript_35764/m.91970 type:complete len:241 (-) Transcript_35764:503-1225(-)
MRRPEKAPFSVTFHERCAGGAAGRLVPRGRGAPGVPTVDSDAGRNVGASTARLVSFNVSRPVIQRPVIVVFGAYLLAPWMTWVMGLSPTQSPWFSAADGLPANCLRMASQSPALLGMRSLIIWLKLLVAAVPMSVRSCGLVTPGGPAGAPRMRATSTRHHTTVGAHVRTADWPSMSCPWASDSQVNCEVERATFSHLGDSALVANPAGWRAGDLDLTLGDWMPLAAVLSPSSVQHLSSAA